MKILLFFLITARVSLSVAVSLAKPGCPDSCGEVPIPYPFGIGPDCYLKEWFSITCNGTLNHQKAFLSALNVEVFNISLEHKTVHINSTMIYESQTGTPPTILNLTNSPYVYSSSNLFVVYGCGIFATISQGDHREIAGCMSICNIPFVNLNSTVCSGTMGCCQVEIPYLFDSKYTVAINRTKDSPSYYYAFAFLVDKHWFSPTKADVSIHGHPGAYTYPLVLDWTLFPNETCFSDVLVSDGFLCSNINVHCATVLGARDPDNDFLLRCMCVDGFEGNPYLPRGCDQDVDECLDPTENSCTNTCYVGSFKKICNTCINVPGSYDCSCPPGYDGDARRDGSGCFLNKKESPIKEILKGSVTGIGLFFVLMSTWLLYRLMKKRQKIKMKEFYFKRNGGLFLQKCKLFSLEELDRASDHFNENRILGRGGQSTVYKGMLSNGRIIAIKRFTLSNERQVKDFINEVQILSQINHRNVVKLLGCCLETEFPLLIYEYVPNGTLSDLLHGPHVQDFQISWSMRVRIATEIARAIFFLHSAASVPIYHRDIKPTNILFDEKYRAKVSDFGISRLISFEQTHLTTQVKGTFGYLDPEYFRSGRFTEKSDIYSLGVVLVELLTGKQLNSAIDDQLGERGSLVDLFLSSMEKNQLLDILDPQVVKEGKKEEIMVMANLAQRCLNMTGKNRPSIQEVAVELEGISIFRQSFMTQENIKHFQEWECNSSLSSTSVYANETMRSSPLDPQLYQPMKFDTR